MTDNSEFESIKNDLVEQKISKAITIADGTTGNITINIPLEKKVFLKGYGYDFANGSTYQLITGNAGFKPRTDQEGSIAQPMIYGVPFKCRPGGKLELAITNETGASVDYNAVFFIMTNDILDVTSDGGAVIQATSVLGGITITDAVTGLNADVIARGDGQNALCVDTEITISGATFVIDNIKVGSNNGLSTGLEYLRTDAAGNLQVEITNGSYTQQVNYDKSAEVCDTPFGKVNRGQQTLTGTAVTRLNNQECRSVRIRPSVLSGSLYIGFYNTFTTSTYFAVLNSITDYIDLPVNNSNLLYVIGANGDVIELNYFTRTASL